MATNPKELLLFLKLNRNTFFIRSNKVSLVKSRPGEENGMESGRSTEGSSTDGRSTVDSTIPNNNNFALFPLTRENVHFIKLVKGLKAAQVRFRMC